MSLRFTICNGCKVSLTLPDDDQYLTLSPWMAAHSKVCPGGGKLHVVAKVRLPRRKKSKLPADSGPAVQPGPDVADFVKAVGKEAAKAAIDGAFEAFFRGKVR